MNTSEFKDASKEAADYLATQGITVPHTRLLEAFSRAFGHRNWSTLKANLDSKATEQVGPAASLPVTPAVEGVDLLPLELFLASGGERCPICWKSGGVLSEEVEADGAEAWDECTCTHCGAEWRSDYKLTGYEVSKRAEIKVLPPEVQSAPEAPAALLEQLVERIIQVVPAPDLNRFAQALLATQGHPFFSTLEEPEELLEDYRSKVAQLAFRLSPGGLRKESMLLAASRVLLPYQEALLQKLAESQEQGPAVRADVVEALTDDVRYRARKHGFSISGRANARGLVEEANDLLDLEATEAELDAAVCALF